MNSDNGSNRNITDPKLVTNEYLLLMLKNGFSSMFLFGALSAITFMLAVIEAKTNEFESFLLFLVFFLFMTGISLAIFFKISKVWLPEVKARLEGEKQI